MTRWSWEPAQLFFPKKMLFGTDHKLWLCQCLKRPDESQRRGLCATSVCLSEAEELRSLSFMSRQQKERKSVHRESLGASKLCVAEAAEAKGRMTGAI